ncbi:unnamed protein product [Medioppia subpectinata]|uniref:AB hydrolase-1 domain-containing protein n=1 Tax=Medioppia subpectinata TaxID=1979941 RepID=A0A7R9KV21_9ACAR|nr:unnamed protein product [Medioppia subpectinata]CAG2109251.1 unnamed protein product [Medioppia subpectinata]
MNDNEINCFCVEVNGWTVWAEKFGSGPKTVLLIPGAIGTGRTDFLEVLEGEDELNYDKFTLIAVELPGWGRSRPPVRKYGTGVYDNDAECLHQLMQELNYNKYSIIGLSDGANVALRMATKYQQSVESLILVSVYTFMGNESLKALTSSQSVDNWNKDKLQSYLQSYDNKDVIQQLWTKYIKFIEYFNQYFPDNKNNYKSIKCKVLLMYGEKGEHNCHQKFSSIFKDVVEDYLLEQFHEKEGDEERRGAIKAFMK